jgi:hypothetical protein
MPGGVRGSGGDPAAYSILVDMLIIYVSEFSSVKYLSIFFPESDTKFLISLATLKYFLSSVSPKNINVKHFVKLDMLYAPLADFKQSDEILLLFQSLIVSLIAEMPP